MPAKNQAGIHSAASASMASAACAPSAKEAQAALRPVFFVSEKQKSTSNALYIQKRNKARQ